jgi:hypothetical protein
VSHLSAQLGVSGAAQARELATLLPPRPRGAPAREESAAAATAGQVLTEAVAPASEDNNAVRSVDDQQAKRSTPSRPDPASRSRSTSCLRRKPRRSSDVRGIALPTLKSPSRRSTRRFLSFNSCFSRAVPSSARRAAFFSSRRQRIRGSSTEPQSRRVAWLLQATAEELSILDSLVVELGAESRSELIAAALEAHLLTKSRR